MPALRRLCLLALLALCAVPAPAAARPPLLLGVQDDALLTSGEPEAWPAVASLHPAVIRYNVAWDAVAPTPPLDPSDPAAPAYDWSKVDAIARHVAELGAAPVFTIVQSPRWADGGVAPSHPPRLASDFGAFCGALARR